jgi:hypothetical protein
LQWAPVPAFVFGGIPNPKELGSMGMTEGEAHSFAAEASVRNPFAKTADAAIKSATYSDEAHRAERAYDEGDSHLPSRKDLLNEPESSQYSPSQAHHQQSGSRIKASSDFQSASISLKKAVNLHQSSNRDDNPHQLARQLIGTSAALAQLKVRSVKGREGAKEVLAVTNFTPYHWKLASEIEKARKEVDEVMDARRKEIQIARARKKATHDKYAHIRKEVDSETKGGSWFKVSLICFSPSLKKNVHKNLTQTPQTFLGGRGGAQKPSPRQARHRRRPFKAAHTRTSRSSEDSLDARTQRLWQQSLGQVEAWSRPRAWAHPL